MKKSILTAIISLTVIPVMAQGWVYSEEFKTDVWTNQDKGMDFVNCKDGVKYDAWNALYCTRKKGIESVTRVGSRTNTSGLTGKVARAVAAQSPKRSGSSTKPSNTRRVGKYNNQFENSRFRRERQAQLQSAREEAEHRKRMEELQRRIADDNRAAAVTAKTSAALQGQTNARIQRDRWHATQGAALAQQRARQAMVRQGPKFDKMKPQSTGPQQASRLRGANKPRRVMAYNPQPRNTERRILPPVARTQSDPLIAAKKQQLRKALAAKVAKMELQRRPQPSRILISMEKSKGWNSGKRFVLDEHAHSTLGQDWKSDDLKPLPYPPAPVTKVRRKMTPEEYHNLIVIEMIDRRPLTPDESKYYDNLSL